MRHHLILSSGYFSYTNAVYSRSVCRGLQKPNKENVLWFYVANYANNDTKNNVLFVSLHTQGDKGRLRWFLETPLYILKI